VNIIDQIISENIEPALNSINVANGFSNNVSVLSGYMVHYAHDLQAHKSDISFPCISYEPESDVVVQSKTGKIAKIGRVFKIIGAVDARDRSLVNSKLNSLVFDIRKAVSINWAEEKTKAESIEIGGCKYSLPDSKDAYAFIEMSITVNYVEDWRK
jgi:hypothetical protein